MPFAVVDEQQRAGRGRHDQILIAVVVDVDEERLRRVVEDADARLVRDVLERRVAAISVEAIGQSGRLRDVQIVESVAVRVADRDALMAVRVARQDRVERRHPRVEIDVELPAERVVAAERRRGDLGEDRAVRARLTRCDAAVHRTTCQPDAFRRHPISHSPTCSTRYAFAPAPTMS